MRSWSRWRSLLCSAFLSREVLGFAACDPRRDGHRLVCVERRPQDAAVGLDPALVFAAEALQRAQHRVRRGLTQAAAAGGLDVLAGLLEVLEVGGFGRARQEAAQPLLQETGPH